MLIAINAAKILITKPNATAVNTIIDVFSAGRRLQQSVCSELLTEHHKDIAPFVISRLEHEEDTYVKVFCYRLLSRLPNQELICGPAKKDILAHSADLKIAALYYIHHTTDPEKNVLINSLAQDPNWEVRAIIAKLLSFYKEEQSLIHLETLLGDKQWWVRLNAAQALVHHEARGLLILQQQHPAHNKEAFEVAQKIVHSLERNVQG